MKRLRSLLLLFATAVAFIVAGDGCSKPPDIDHTSRIGKLRIAVIPKGTSHEFWLSVLAGARRAEEEFEGIEVTWKGPPSEGNTAEQIQIVESFIADGYDGICLAPADAIALRKPVEQALAMGIPVVIFDSGLDDLSGVVSFVATDNHHGGLTAGHHLAELLGGEGDVILMRYELNSASTTAREEGFLEAINKYEDIQLLSADKYAGPDEAGAIALAEDLLSNYQDEVDGMFCPNQSTASGTLTVLSRQFPELAEKIRLVGFDSGPNIAEGIETGAMQGTVLQDPVQMGYDAVRVMVDHLKGQPVNDRIETQEVLATPHNKDTETVRTLLYPAQAE